jgi:hypothetical protein
VRAFHISAQIFFVFAREEAKQSRCRVNQLELFLLKREFARM